MRKDGLKATIQVRGIRTGGNHDQHASGEPNLIADEVRARTIRRREYRPRLTAALDGFGDGSLSRDHRVGLSRYLRSGRLGVDAPVIQHLRHVVDAVRALDEPQYQIVILTTLKSLAHAAKLFD